MQRNFAPTNNLRTVPESSLACGRLRRNAQAKHLRIVPRRAPATTGADFREVPRDHLQYTPCTDVVLQPNSLHRAN
jgi:hypothetical protein